MDIEKCLLHTRNKMTSTNIKLFLARNRHGFLGDTLFYFLLRITNLLSCNYIIYPYLYFLQAP